MPKIIPGNWSIELNEEQIDAIDWYVKNPPKWYVRFYRVWKYFLKYAIFSLILLCIILGVIHASSQSIDLFDTIKYIFFADCGLVLIALFYHLRKLFYTKKYAKRVGLSLKEWDWVTIGQKWDI